MSLAAEHVQVGQVMQMLAQQLPRASNGTPLSSSWHTRHPFTLMKISRRILPTAVIVSSQLYLLQALSSDGTLNQ